MKIGILTYHRSNNVGALLQNYALLKAFEKLDCDAETIDYRCKFIEQQNRIFVWRGLKDSIKILLQLPYYILREKRFKHFRSLYIKKSKFIYNHDNVSSSALHYELFVSGSDQVWNLNLNGGDYTYLLDFVPNDKFRISYAGSFGYLHIPNNYEEKTLSELRRFSLLSVREKSAQQMLEHYGIDSTIVLDPTLLLLGQEWKKQFNLNKSSAKKYVFVYMVAYVPELLEKAREKAEELNCELLVMHYNYRPFPKCKNVRAASPASFLQLIDEAEYVFCSSFHAMCFSILFHKNFFYGLDKSKNNNNSRLETLAKVLKLTSRNIECAEFSDIDYSNVDLNLSVLRKEAFNFLIKIKNLTKNDISYNTSI